MFEQYSTIQGITNGSNTCYLSTATANRLLQAMSLSQVDQLLVLTAKMAEIEKTAEEDISFARLDKF